MQTRISDIHLIQRLKSASDPLSYSFSNRYTRWRHRYGIHKVSGKELQRLNKKQINVLDIACNEGYLIFELKTLFDNKYDIHYTGIDINPEYTEIANQKKKFFQAQNCDFKVMDANELKFEDNQFDIITCAALIEHIENPIVVLTEIKRILKPCGSVILTTPNSKRGGVPEKIIGLFKKLIKKDKYTFKTDNNNFGKFDLGHVSVKNRKAWSNLFQKVGFKIFSTKGTSGLIFGSPKLDEHRILFGIMIIADVLLEHLPFSYVWSIDLLFVLRKNEFL